MVLIAHQHLHDILHASKTCFINPSLATIA